MGTHTSRWLAVAFLIAALVGRFSSLPQNFWLFGAATVFAGCYLRGGMAIGLPLAMFGLSDVIGHMSGFRGVHFYFGWTMLFNYIALAGYAAFGCLIRKHDVLPVAVLATLGGSISFFLISNFAAWLDPHMGYRGSWLGLRDCYVAAIPFYRNTVTADLVFGFLMFGMHHGILAMLRKPQPVRRSSR